MSSNSAAIREGRFVYNTAIVRLAVEKERCAMGEEPSQDHKATNSLHAAMVALYPDLQKRSYFLPPIHFNHEAYHTENVAGQEILVTQTDSTNSQPRNPSPRSGNSPALEHRPVVQESLLREDTCHQHVLHCLQALADLDGDGVMFVISKLSFSGYLSKPSFLETAKRLPRPYTLPRQYRRGEFNILVIHRRCGILVGEVKAVGLNARDLHKPQELAEDDIARRVDKALMQLNKSQTMVEHLMSDVTKSLRVRKTLMLPYVSCRQLQSVLEAQPQLEQKCCECLGVPTGADFVQLCLCSDFVSDPSTPWQTEGCMQHLKNWWQRLMTDSADHSMTNDLYLDLVARFGGPATSVDIYCTTPPRLEIRTEGQAVSETGERLARLVLTPNQVKLLTESPAQVALVGPPGTGKTVMLVLVGLQWLLEGKHVYIVSLHLGSRAASHLIHHQLQATLSRMADIQAVPYAGKPHLLLHNLVDGQTDTVESVVNTVKRTMSPEGELHVLCDEFCSEDFDKEATLFKEFATQLASCIPHLYLWAASMRYRKEESLPGFQVHTPTVPLRCTPVVQREVEHVMEDMKLDRFSGLPLMYTPNTVPSPCEGPEVIRISHKDHYYKGKNPVKCSQCGKEIAHILRHQLQIGKSVNDIMEDGNGTSVRPPDLKYQDVFVLTNAHFRDDVISGNGQVLSYASPLLQGMRNSGLPVTVVKSCDSDRRGWEGNIAEVATSSQDVVTVANYWELAGLERKVVVLVPGGLTDGRHGHQIDVKPEKKYKLQTLVAMSRCTSQLIIVDSS